MAKRIATLSLLLVGGAAPLLAHDLFLKLDTYFVAPNRDVRVLVLNGTFTESEAPVARSRLTDISVVSADGRARLDTTAWTVAGDSSWLAMRTAGAGTYVLGASLRTTVLELTAEQFNAYLREDGLTDVLEARTRNDELDRGARERYAKHVKAIVQVGERRTDTFGAVLGYPAEIVPLTNPYRLEVGDDLRVRCLVDGRPVRGQTVFAGGERFEQRMVRTDDAGVARFTIDRPGKWYVKFTNLVRVDEPGLDYESKWATLTFEVR